MLLDNFFYIRSINVTDDTINASLEINKEHTIFQGHFPGQPVVPGVCMMQMVKEIVEQVTAKKLHLSKAAEMKFLAIIDPVKNNLVDTIVKFTPQENEGILVTASFAKDELTHFKFKGTFAAQ